MVLKRKIYKSFLDWKANWAGKRALLVQGARRIGKSTIVEEFARNEYETYILINFQSDLGNKSQTLLKYIVKQAGLGGLSQIASDTAGTVVNTVFDILTSIIP